MNKFLIVALISLSVAFACHPSCATCVAGTRNVCETCVDPNSSVDSVQRSCPCNSGYYTKTVSPVFSCAQSLSANGGVSTLNACSLEIGLKTKNVFVDTNCYPSLEGTTNYVISDIFLNFDQVSMTQECKDAYVTSLYYKNPNTDLYVLIPATLVITNSNISYKLRVPLIDVNLIAYSTEVRADQIFQLVHLQITLSTSTKLIRTHKWDLNVYTNRDQVQTFNIDVTIQETSGCQPNEDCIIVADLTTSSEICSDASCTAPAITTTYVVGDIFYAKIWFDDPTYTKKLDFTGLLFKDAEGGIYDFTAITTATWVIDHLVIALPLVEPTAAATIQVNMLISDVSSLRALAAASASSTSTQSEQFSTVILSKNGSSTSSAFTFVFGLINLLALVLLF